MWLFNTLVTQTVLYGVKTWGLSLKKDNNRKDFDYQIRKGRTCISPRTSLGGKMAYCKAHILHTSEVVDLSSGTLIWTYIYPAAQCDRAIGTSSHWFIVVEYLAYNTYRIRMLNILQVINK